MISPNHFEAIKKFLTIVGDSEDIFNGLVESCELHKEGFWREEAHSFWDLFFYVCYEFSIPRTLLTRFVSVIKDNLFDILKFPSISPRKSIYFFELLNELECQSKRDYEFFDLSDPRYVDSLSILNLFLILGPESRLPALKVICQTTKAFENISNISLRGLIEEISRAPDNCVLFKSLIDNAAASDCEYFAKSELLCFLIEKLKILSGFEPLKDNEEYVLEAKVVSYIESRLHNDFMRKLFKNLPILDHVEAVCSSSKSNVKAAKRLTSKIDNQRLIAFIEEALSNMKKLTTHSQGR